MAWPWDRIPPWATSLFVQPMSEMADRLRHPEFITTVRGRLDQALGDIPDAAARRVDQMVRTAKRAAESVQKWASDRTAPAITIVNATGVLFPAQARQHPLSPEVAMAWSAAASAWSDAPAPHEPSRAERAWRSQSRAWTGYSARIAASWPAAIYAATMLGHGPIFTPRSSALQVDSVGPLPDVLRASPREVIEFGTPFATDPLSELPAATPAGLLVVWIRDAAGLEGLKRFQRPGWTKIIIAPQAWPMDPQLPVVTEPLTLAALKEAGADVVITPGGELLGGPACGVLWGDEERLSPLDHQPLWSVCRADAPTHAACLTALDLWSQGLATQRFGSLSLLAASMENLRHRANQLATRLGVLEDLTCDIVEGNARLWPDVGPAIPSVQLKLRHSKHSADAWVAALAKQSPAVWANVAGEDVVLDLRSIEPAAEAALIAALGGEPNP